MPDAKRRLLGLLVGLIRRVDEDIAEFNRFPTVFRVSVRHRSSRRYSGRTSRQCRVPIHMFSRSAKPASHADVLHRATLVLSTAFALFEKLVDTAAPFHLTLLNVAVSKFTNAAPTRTSVDAFFAAAPTSTTRVPRPETGLKRDRGGAAGVEEAEVDWSVYSTLPPAMKLELRRQWKRRRK